MSITEKFGSLKPARQRFDLPTYTVMLHPIPQEFLNPEQLQKTLENSGIREIKSIQFIGNFEEMNKIMDKRNSTLSQLEAALKVVSDKLMKSDNNNNESTHPDQISLTVKERSNLLYQLINDREFCSDIRLRHKLPRPNKSKSKSKSDDNDDDSLVDSDGTVDSLQYLYKKLEEYESQLQSALIEFNAIKSKTPIEDISSAATDVDATEASASEDPTNDDKTATFDFEKRYIDETTFISWNKVADFRHNLTEVSTLIQTQTALLHFSDYRQACRAHQLLISSQPNSMIAKIAPKPDDLNWENVNLNERQRWTNLIKSNCFYWAFVILFAPCSAVIISFVDMEAVGKWVSSIEEFRQKNSAIKEVLQGVLAPMVATLLFKKTGTVIDFIMDMRGPVSKPDHTLKTQSAHVFFLFFQIIFIGAIFSNIYGFITSTLISTEKFVLLDHIRTNMPKKAHFFFNFMLQDIFKEIFIELLNPKELFFNRAYLSDSGRKEKTPRVLLQNDNSPPDLELGLVWSRFIIFPYFIFMTYVVVAPLIVLPAIGYFGAAYFVYRFRLIQFGRVYTETGGMFWCQCTQQIIYGLILCQLSVLLQYTQFKKGFWPSLLLTVLLCISIAFIPFLKYYFGRICDSLSILEDDNKNTRNLVQSILQGQNAVIPGAVEYMENSSIVKSRLESNMKDHYNFVDADPAAIENYTQKFKLEDNNEESETKALFDPYWSIVPLNLGRTEDPTETFDPLQVDELVDTAYALKQYEHPLILKHTQIIMIPNELPLLLRQRKQK